MKVPTKKSFKSIVINLIIMFITFIVISLIKYGSFSRIQWDILLIMLLTYLIVSLILSDKKEKSERPN